jgi:hypothetical protein
MVRRRFTSTSLSSVLLNLRKSVVSVSYIINQVYWFFFNKLIFSLFLVFHTFFGGSDSTWKTPGRQFSYFKNFELKAFY